MLPAASQWHYVNEAVAERVLMFLLSKDAYYSSPTNSLTMYKIFTLNVVKLVLKENSQADMSSY